MNSLAPYDKLQDLNTDGSVPNTRVSTPDAARAIAQNMVQANDKRFLRNSRVKGMVDGNPPWNQAELDAKNMRFRSNFNTGEAESFLDVAKSAFYDLFFEVEHFSQVECLYGTSDERVSYSGILTEEFDALQEKDRKFDWNMQTSQHDMVLYGAGPWVFDNKYEWRGRRTRFSNMLLPDDAESYTEEWSQMALMANYRTDELYGFIKNEAAATAVGWDVKNVKDAIIYASSTWLPIQGNWGQQWEQNQQMLRDNDIYHGNRSSRVQIYRLFYREFVEGDEEQGMITEAWITQMGNPNGFLFHRVRRYKSWTEIIHPFFYDKGDGTAHGVRGLGVKMYKALLAKMRLDNSTVDSAQARTTVMLQAVNEKQFNMPQHFGPYTILPPNHTYVQQAIGGVLDAPIAVSRELANQLAVNLSQYRSRVDKPQGNPRTKYEVQQTVNQQNTLNKTQINRYYEQLDDFYEERYRRASNPNILEQNPGAKLALEFQKRCIERGVPKIAMLKVKVTATRAIGQGNPFMRQQTLGELIGTIGQSLPEQGKQRLISDFIAASAGYAFAKRYNPQPEGKSMFTDQEADAFLQVAAMKVGVPAVPTPTQNHAIYAEIFIQAGAQAAASLQQGANPMEVASFIELLGRGIAPHLQALANDPLHQQVYQAVANQFKKLSQFHDQLMEQIKTMQEQQAQQQQTTTQAMTDEQIATAKAQNDIQRRNAKAQQDMAIKNAKAQQALAKGTQDMSLSDAKTATEIRNQTAKTEAAMATQ